MLGPQSRSCQLRCHASTTSRHDDHVVCRTQLDAGPCRVVAAECTGLHYAGSTRCEETGLADKKKNKKDKKG
jgi:hypothetical protein